MTNNHHPLHLSEKTARLPAADVSLTTDDEKAEINPSMRTRDIDAQRRNPYGVRASSDESHDSLKYKSGNDNDLSRLGNQSTINADRNSGHTDPVFPEHSIANKVRSPAYSSFKHGAKSIAKSRQANYSWNTSKSSNQRSHPFMISSSHLDSAPDAVFAASKLLRRGQKLVDDLNGASEIRVRYQVFLFVAVMIVLMVSAPSMIDPILRERGWKWTDDRRLDDRQCVMNLFIERQKPDEYNPDYVKPEVDPDSLRTLISGGRNTIKHPPPEIEEGTYRSKGQVKVIGRLIEAVANSYRSNIKVQQHIIFTGSRDGGHLAELALKHWPPRGSHLTQLHVIAADHDNNEHLFKHTVPGILVEDPLGYGFLEALENRFMGKEVVHVYDRYGEASLSVELDDDDDAAMDVPWKSSRRKLQVENDNEEMITNDAKESLFANTVNYENDKLITDERSGSYHPYLNISSLIPIEDDDVHVIPYLHVDGVSMASQLEILESARSLMEENRITVIGVEHSPDMNVYELLDFFDSAKYKTFFLGRRKIARIDHICREILEDVIRHPSIMSPKLTRTGRLLKKIGLLSSDFDMEDDQRYKYPPFFVAMPRGRLSKEEMTIQHMYDLFGAVDGDGGAQVLTANDRKRPT